MSSIAIVGYALFCIIVFFLINRLLRKKKTNVGEEQVPAVSKIEVSQAETVEKELEQKQETEASNVVELETGKQEQVKQEKEMLKRQLPVENVNVKAVVAVLILGMFVSILNQTIINVALPPLMNEFNVSTSTAQWLITGFMLVNGILVPISAFLVSRFTYRKLFIAAMLFFTVGSIICATSGNFTMMMTGRVIQAVGAGILMPVGMNIFMTLFPPNKRGAAMGLLGVAMILAPAIGPTVTGWVIENYSWNLMFYGMFVIGLIITFLSFKFFTLAQPVSKTKLDVFGVISSSIGLGSLLYGFSEAGNNGWTSAEVVITLIIGVIGLAVFIWRELTTDNKMLDLQVFKYPTFTFTLVINAIVTMALFGGMLLLPVYLQNIRGFTPMESGLLLLPGSLIMGIMGPVAGKLFDKYGIRPLAIVGLAITTFATYKFTTLSMDTPYSVIMTDYIIRSIGMSFIMMPIMTAGMNALPMKLISHGTATQNTSRQVAGSIGTAILITLMTQQTTAHVADYGNMLTTSNPILVDKVHGMGQSLAALAGSAQAGDAMSTQLLFGQISKLSAINGINDAFLIATILAGIAWVLSFFLPSGNKPNRKAGN
ncbi:MULTISPECIES: DHA2 family efflux MFS transporter permease subunit [Bacillus]|jgi:EmrB/QacA subfamily drug resistance transporter|uniref:DHA2 family efflux MFS transporter permease subunit n=1 Tax=Bacillus mycoides TaxID=1405 RepID=A0AAP8BFG0_BACMY|nr:MULTISPECIES: DHA2 family efflux MFS transporter permease subunit [Bacillus]AJH18252.1 drug resistance MFS transporter, drug:H+ antiporter-2 family protein [Bacillus mycoides]EEL97315.1 Drug resistance transporter, EmrB/QacA [Bacillus mycoides DSM 2048]EJQ57821.1 drug:H+ antiporter-2 (14 Spanner) (DHA2) family drug resistance MFS transporter [Bacillus mycoides]EJQ69588.1 drug:H+ antiporter-2 (14 Spanner) (DHA2) family drug resistance MFS transporter [Bacillus mycoides]EJS08075.1 drug:H+ ant